MVNYNSVSISRLLLILEIIALASCRIKNSPYQELGLPQGSSWNAVKKAFKELSLQYHPDRHPDPDSHRQRYQQIIEAYEEIKKQ